MQQHLFYSFISVFLRFILVNVEGCSLSFSLLYSILQFERNLFIHFPIGGHLDLAFWQHKECCYSLTYVSWCVCVRAPVTLGYTPDLKVFINHLVAKACSRFNFPSTSEF